MVVRRVHKEGAAWPRLTLAGHGNGYSPDAPRTSISAVNGHRFLPRYGHRFSPRGRSRWTGRAASQQCRRADGRAACPGHYIWLGARGARDLRDTLLAGFSSEGE
jgi:hypothetical protein